MNLEAGRIAAALRPAESTTRWRVSRKIARAQIILALLALDLAALFVAYVGAEMLYGWLQPSGGGIMGRGFALSMAMAPIFVAVAANAGAYSTDIFSDRGGGISRSLRALLLTLGILAFLALYLRVGDAVSRGTFSLVAVFSVVLLATCRALFIRNARRIVGPGIYNTVLISDGAPLATTSHYSTYIAADSWLNPDNDCPVMYDRLARALRESDRVVVACAPERRSAWVKALKGANVRSEVVAPELEDLQPLGVSQWSRTPTLIIADGPLSTADAVVKRCFDISLSLGALIVLAPVFAVLAVLIKLESEGPVFFNQTRIGLGNRLFNMHKFRSMRQDNCDSAGARSASRDDDRITRIGRFIRKTSLDELPQLINVLKGQMSIVGPRPHALGSRAADKLFWEVDDRYWQRHATKPGLTGLAQVRGFRGATEHERDLTDRLYADLEYLKNWSIWRDLVIIIQTFRVIVHRNAF